MRRILITAFSCIFLCTDLVAQNNLGSSTDTERIAITVMFAEASNIPQYARSSLKSRLDGLVNSCGLGASADSRFVLTAKVDVIEKRITATYPVQTIVDIVPTFYIGDGETGQLFATCSCEQMRGMGDNENRAYLAALKGVKSNDPALREFVAKGRDAVIEYYNSNIDFLLADAQSLCDAERYDEAMATLATVPTVCKDAYMRAKEMIGEVYQKKIDAEGARLLSRARNEWNADKSEAGASRAIEFLGEINPFSSSQPEAEKLSAAIAQHYAELEARRRELEERQWEFKMRQYEDSKAEREKQNERSFALETQRIEAGKQVNERVAAVQKMAFDAALEVAKNGSAAGSFLKKISLWLK